MCTYDVMTVMCSVVVAGTGALVPESIVMPLQYNLSLALSWGHFLSVRGKAAPTTFEASSVATLRALRSASCLVLHSQGLEYSQVHHPLNGRLRLVHNILKGSMIQDM